MKSDESERHKHASQSQTHMTKRNAHKKNGSTEVNKIYQWQLIDKLCAWQYACSHDRLIFMTDCDHYRFFFLLLAGSKKKIVIKMESSS